MKNAQGIYGRKRASCFEMLFPCVYLCGLLMPAPSAGLNVAFNDMFRVVHTSLAQLQVKLLSSQLINLMAAGLSFSATAGDGGVLGASWFNCAA